MFQADNPFYIVNGPNTSIPKKACCPESIWVSVVVRGVAGACNALYKTCDRQRYNCDGVLTKTGGDEVRVLCSLVWRSVLCRNAATALLGFGTLAHVQESALQVNVYRNLCLFALLRHLWHLCAHVLCRTLSLRYKMGKLNDRAFEIILKYQLSKVVWTLYCSILIHNQNLHTGCMDMYELLM